MSRLAAASRCIVGVTWEYRSSVRIAIQPVAYVGPNQIGWFQFTIEAPTTPGHYRLDLRPLIEGANWMEDTGVFWPVTVLNQDGSTPPVSALHIVLPLSEPQIR